MEKDLRKKPFFDAALLCFAWLFSSLALSLLPSAAVRELLLPLSFLPPFAIFALSRGFSGYRRPPERGSLSATLLLSAPFTLALLVCTVAVSALTAHLASALGAETGDFSTELSFPLAIVIHALIPAIAEETLFRYMLPRIFEPLGTGATVALTALLFSVSHLHPTALPYALLAGVMLGLAAAITGAPYLSAFAHFVNNLAGVAIFFVSREQSPAGGIALLVSFILLVAASTVSLVLLLIFKRKGKKVIPPPGNTDTAPPKAGEVLRSPVAFFAIACILIGVIGTIAK